MEVKRIIWIFMLGLMTLGSNLGFSREKNNTVTLEQREVVKLIQGLYNISPEIFDAREFDYDYKKMRGNYSISRHNDLLNQYFDEKILVLSKFPISSKPGNNKKHSVAKSDVGYEVPIRYPKIPDLNDLLWQNRSDPLPKIKILTPIVYNDRAKVVVKISDGSLCHYFLKKLPQGWRIYKVRSFEVEFDNLYLLKGPGNMIEYPSGNEYRSDRNEKKLTEW